MQKTSLNKRFLTLFITAVLILSCTVAPVAASNHNFMDVQSTDWFADAIDYVYDNGLMNGTATDTFSPNMTMTRAMLVTVLYRMDGANAVSDETPFTDIDPNGYYAPALRWAYKNEIINGLDANSFGPNVDITRQMMVTIFYRYAKYADMDVTETADMGKYVDAGSIADYAKTAFS